MADIHALTPGQLVFSKRGRDRGHPFVVMKLEGVYVWLADGRLRRADKPKMKKLMHVQPVKMVSEEIKEKITEQQSVTDADLRRAIDFSLCDKAFLSHKSETDVSSM